MGQKLGGNTKNVIFKCKLSIWSIEVNGGEFEYFVLHYYMLINLITKASIVNIVTDITFISDVNKEFGCG